MNDFFSEIYGTSLKKFGGHEPNRWEIFGTIYPAFHHYNLKPFFDKRMKI